MIKIFIIDDNEDFVLLFCQAVAKSHPECQCLSAENGYSALRQLKFMLPTVPDFIFVDVKMPIMNGHEIVAELKKTDLLSSVPIVMYSAQAYPEDKAIAAAAGIVRFYEKPSTAEKLNMMVNDTLKTKNS
jgi:CheY-like chemotaxis protein